MSKFLAKVPALLVAGLCILILLSISACDDSSPAGGFTVYTSEGVTDPIFGTGLTINSPVSGIQVIGSYITMISSGTQEGYVLNFTHIRMQVRYSSLAVRILLGGT